MQRAVFSLRGLISLCLALLLIGGGLIAFLVTEKRVAEGWVSHTFAVADQLSRTRVLMLRAEVQKRGFVLGGEPQLKTEAMAFQKQAGAELAKLPGMTADNPKQSRRIEALRKLYRERVAVTQAILRLTTEKKPEAAAALALSPENRARQERWTEMIEEADREERTLLQTRQSTFKRLEMTVEVAIALCAAVILALWLLMARERRARLQRLSELNERLEEDLERRKRLETELVTARANAEAAAESKSSFLANMSHEIRTPMNGVLGFTDLLLSSKLDPEQRRQAQLIADSGKAMMRLLNDILDISRIEAGQIEIAPERVDLHHKLRNCAKLLQPAAAQKHIELECRIAPAVPQFVMIDGLRMRQVILNLLGNAVKFTHEGSVTLSADIRNGLLEIRIADTGIGIPADRREAVFEQFVQAEQTTARRFGGTGLGLAISKSLAELMRGSLDFESEVGRGTTFTLRVPIREAEEKDRRDAPAAPFSGEGTAAHILLAEDHDVNQELMQAMLARLGHRVTLVSDGAQAVAAVTAAVAQGSGFDLVLMDIQMPIMDGLAATHAIRAAGVGPEELPIVALTANAYADDIETCLAAGMQAHLAKPIRLGQLSTAIESWARRRGSGGEGDLAAAASL